METILEMDDEESKSGNTMDAGKTFDDLQRAYGFLLSACKLKETQPPGDVSANMR